MSEPEVKFEIDEHGRIGYRVTNEGVLLSKDEKEFIIDHVTRMQSENAKLRELAKNSLRYIKQSGCGVRDPYVGTFEPSRDCEDCEHWDRASCCWCIQRHADELGIEVDE